MFDSRRLYFHGTIVYIKNIHSSQIERKLSYTLISLYCNYTLQTKYNDLNLIGCNFLSYF